MPRKRHITREFAERLLLMGAQTQDRLGFPWGNCLEAAYATVLGVDLDTVPDPRNRCQGKDAVCATDALPLRDPAILDWLAEDFGLTAISGDGPHPPGVMLRKGGVPLFWIASGKSGRGYYHAVVYSNGRLIFDPHPDRTGLLAVEGWTILVPLGPLRNRVLPGWVVPASGVAALGQRPKMGRRRKAKRPAPVKPVPPAS